MLWKGTKKYVILTAVLFLSFVALKVSACFMPDDLVNQNVKVSLKYMLEEGKYPSAYANNKYLYSQRADNYSDAIFLNVVYNMTKTAPLQAAACDYIGNAEGDHPVEVAENMVNTDDYSLFSYARQWFGTAAVLRFFLVLFDYQQIRVMSQYFLYILLGIAVLLVNKTIGFKEAVAFLASVSIVSLDVTASSANLAGAFYCMLAGVIMVCTLYYDGNIPKCMVMYIVGAVTAYFDLFSTPFLTVVVGIFILLIDYKNHSINNLTEGLKEMLRLSFSWLAGYIILWMAKWLFASVLSGTNVFADAIKEMYAQSVQINVIDWGPDTTWGYITESLRLCFENMFPVNYIKIVMEKIGKGPVIIFLITGITLLFLHWLKVRKETKELWFPALMLIIAIFPYICYIVMHTHAFIHFWMWFRMQIIAWFALCAAYIHSVKDISVSKKLS